MAARRDRPKLYWKVTGRDGANETWFDETFPLHFFSEQQMRAFLQMCAAKSSLSYAEIAFAACRKNLRTNHLEIDLWDRALGPAMLACGPMKEWIAYVVDEHGKRITVANV